MNASPAHRLASRRGKYTILGLAFAIITFGSLAAPDRLLVGVPLAFLAAPENYAGFGGIELAGNRVAKAWGMIGRRFTYDDDDDDDDKTKTPKPTEETEVTPTATPPAEPTQTAAQLSPTATYLNPTSTQTLPVERPTRQPPSVTPPLSHSGSGSVVNTPTKSPTPIVTITPTASAIASETSVTTSTPEPPANERLLDFVPQPQDPTVRVLLPYVFPVAVVVGLFCIALYQIMLKKNYF